MLSPHYVARRSSLRLRVSMARSLQWEAYTYIRMNNYSNSRPLYRFILLVLPPPLLFIHFAPGPSHRYPCRFGL